MRYWKLLIGTSLLALGLTACSGGKKELSIDVDKLADELQSQTVTSDTLAATAPEMLPSIYFLDSEQLVKGAAYMSSGATACEVAVVECKEASQAEAVEKLFETRVSNQSELFASYNPGEVSRLDGAVIESAGNYAVLCVCDDPDKAEKLLKDYGF